MSYDSRWSSQRDDHRLNERANGDLSLCAALVKTEVHHRPAGLLSSRAGLGVRTVAELGQHAEHTRPARSAPSIPAAVNKNTLDQGVGQVEGG